MSKRKWKTIDFENLNLQVCGLMLLFERQQDEILTLRMNAEAHHKATIEARSAIEDLRRVADVQGKALRDERLRITEARVNMSGDVDAICGNLRTVEADTGRLLSMIDDLTARIHMLEQAQEGFRGAVTSDFEKHTARIDNLVESVNGLSTLCALRQESRGEK